MDLSGAHVLVTGASRGIGAAMARRFAGQGARLSLVARTVDDLGRLADRRHVRTLRRLAVSYWLREAPTRIDGAVLKGVPTGPQEH